MHVQPVLVKVLCDHHAGLDDARLLREFALGKDLGCISWSMGALAGLVCHGRGGATLHLRRRGGDEDGCNVEKEDAK